MLNRGGGVVRWLRRSRRTRGTLAENVAAEFLKLIGMRIVERNFFFRHKEIDIIAQSGDVIVFVEV